METAASDAGDPLMLPDNPDALGTGFLSYLLRSSKSKISDRKMPTARTVSISPCQRQAPADTTLFSTIEFHSRYFMGHKSRGVALIINNKSFQGLELLDRTGSDRDATALEETFLLLGFTRANIHRYNDVTSQNMEKLMKYFASVQDYQNMDCFICAILSHGEDGAVYGHDMKISLEELFRPFKLHVHPTLVGKPKIFIIQACRGEKVDDGAILERDAPCVKLIPFTLVSDILYAYSTVPGYYSWRNPEKGSWFVQAISDNVKKHQKTADMDFLRLLTRVNHEVAYEYQCYSPNNPKTHQKKQMPSIVSTLTKDLFFHH